MTSEEKEALCNAGDIDVCYAEFCDRNGEVISYEKNV